MTATAFTTKERKHVLSIDGGGFRGYTCLIMLHHLMRQLVKSPTDDIPPPCQVFDLICGTSTGGLIAVLLGRLGLDCLTAMGVYRELVTIFFKEVDQKTVDKMDGSDGAFTSGFEEKLAATIEKYAGDKDAPMKVSKSHPDKVVHLSTDTFITVVQSTAGAAGVEPYRVRSYTTPSRGGVNIVGREWTICEAIRAAIALPGYVKPVHIESQSFQDASLSGSANPVWAAISEVELRWSKDCEPLMISLGTGLVSLLSDQEPSDEDAKPLGATGSQHPRGILSSSAFSEQLLGVARDTELVHRRAKEFFKDMNLAYNYFHFDPTGGLGDIRVSDVTQVPRITALTNAWLRAPEGYEETAGAYRALKERFTRNQTQRKPQHSKVTAQLDKSSGTLEGGQVSETENDIINPSPRTNEQGHLEKNSDPANSPVSQSAPLTVNGDVSSLGQQAPIQSDICPPERPSPTADEGFLSVYKARIKPLKKLFFPQNARSIRAVEGRKDKQTELNSLIRVLSSSPMRLKRGSDAVGSGRHSDIRQLSTGCDRWRQF